MQNQQILFTGEAGPAVANRARIILAPHGAQPLHEVFAEAILEDASAHQRRNPLDWIASIGAHVAIVALLVVLPLYFTAGLDSQRLNLTFLAPPLMPAAAPPPPPLAATTAPRPARTTHVLTPGQLVAPTFIPKAVAMVSGGTGAPPEDPLAGVPGGVSGGQVGGVLGGVLGGSMKAVVPPPVSEGPKAPVRVGGNVKPPRLVFGPEPEYPTLARQARLSGVVIIEAIIDEHGEVKGMRVVSGHPLLVQAALKAVSRRRYEPTILDGEPTPIDLRVEISFSVS